ncbi:serine hydrolase [Corynebacterium vitaeruminis]|uniref:serine hydrolase n=1 Tax=Corynebacterium vitaeruminis TaxID=38305 RepID=UPI0006616BEA|nr:serine hydrolase [Corynebacterium vitaeruminis]
MVHCPQRARRGIAASLAAVITLSATTPLANATAAAHADSTDADAFSQVVIAAPSSTTQTKPSEAKPKKSTDTTAGKTTETTPEKTTGKSSETSTEKTSSTESERPSTEPSESPAKTEPKNFAPLVPGTKTQWGHGVQTRLDEVTGKFDAKGGMLGMGILDRQTGEFICNSHCDDAFHLASLMKVFVADVVAYSNYTPPKKGEIVAGKGDMPVTGNPDAMLRDDMIRYSNNEATDALWNSYGGVRIVDNVRQRYGLSDKTQGSPMWGATTSTPADMVAYFDRMLSEEGGLSDTETRYMRQLMYSLPRYSYGDADQNFGLRAALPKETIANKSGWYEGQHTTAGFLGDDDRFAIAVLGNNLTANELTEAVKYVFPGGQVLPTDKKKTKYAYTSAPVPAQDESSQVNPALWALLAALAGFGIGWLIRGQRAD